MSHEEILSELRLSLRGRVLLPKQSHSQLRRLLHTPTITYRVTENIVSIMLLLQHLPDHARISNEHTQQCGHFFANIPMQSANAPMHFANPNPTRGQAFFRHHHNGNPTYTSSQADPTLLDHLSTLSRLAGPREPPHL